VLILSRARVLDFTMSVAFGGMFFVLVMRLMRNGMACTRLNAICTDFSAEILSTENLTYLNQA